MKIYDFCRSSRVGFLIIATAIAACSKTESVSQQTTSVASATIQPEADTTPPRPANVPGPAVASNLPSSEAGSTPSPTVQLPSDVVTAVNAATDAVAQSEQAVADIKAGKHIAAAEEPEVNSANFASEGTLRTSGLTSRFEADDGNVYTFASNSESGQYIFSFCHAFGRCWISAEAKDGTITGVYSAGAR